MKNSFIMVLIILMISVLTVSGQFTNSGKSVMVNSTNYTFLDSNVIPSNKLAVTIGDISGNATTTTVIGIRGKPIAAPSAGDDGKVIEYDNASGTFVYGEGGGGGGGIASAATNLVGPTSTVAGLLVSTNVNLSGYFSGFVGGKSGLLKQPGYELSGRVVAWGKNDAGQINVPVDASNSIISVAGGSLYSLALRSDGRVVAWGNNTYGQINVPVDASNSVVAISSGSGFAIALRSDGRVVAWGKNDIGQINVPVDASNSVIKIFGGLYNSVALRSDGRVVAWGGNHVGQRNVPVDASNSVISISGGSSHPVALRSDGRVVAWGLNVNGQCNVPIDASNSVIAVGGGSFHTLAVVGKQKTPGLIVTGDIVPAYSNRFDLGTTNSPFKDAYLGENSLKYVDGNGVVVASLSASTVGSLTGQSTNYVPLNSSNPTGANNVVTLGYFNSLFNTRVTNAIYTSTNIYTYVNTGDVFRVTLTNNAILMNPSNSVDGRAITWWVRQDAVGERTIDLGTKFKIPSSASLPLSWSTNPSGMTMFAARYDSVVDKWYVLSLVPGY